MLQNKLFLLGLSLFIASILVNTMLAYTSKKEVSYLSVGQIGLVIVLVSSFLCFVLAYQNMPPGLYHSDKNLFYEYLFWGGGHLLQFAFTQGMFLVYLIISDVSLASNSKNTILPLFINTILAVGAPFVYFVYPVDSAKLIQFFTWHMRIAGAVLPCFLIILVCSTSELFLMIKATIYCIHFCCSLMEMCSEC
ncbi:hypothetical protein [Wolbachia endosymbiont (group A) of Icerya purchasi]|uniref:hypothetical protein n=1 Tax=Wolbachia endosymbiont (group A) of Icerya purchasi TaxID=2954019 RepID=UPI00222EE768|nr:hypothetical protein [Wolbachia endosymbiont (group A) of Icerya purchasi]